MNTATEWKKNGLAAAAAEAEPLKLPSGTTILARRPDALQIAMWGQLPLGLAAAVQGTGGKRSPEEVMAAVTLSRDVLSYCCVSPRISLTPVGDSEIHPRDIPNGDVLFILRWARRGEEAESLSTFRDERESGGAGSGSEDVRHAAIIDAEDRRSSAGAGSGPGRDVLPPAISIRAIG